jgi:hypothetical protein
MSDMFVPKRRLAAIAPIAMLLALVVAPSISLAHERRTIGGGKYDVVVGWDVEPAYVSQKNGASIRISKAGTNPAEPVTGAEKTLKVDIRQGATTKTFDLRAVFGQPGYYVADILPTRDGEYQWTFNGSLGDDKISEKFDTADGKFNKVEAATTLEVPVAAPDPVQANADLQAARSTAQSAQTLAMVGVGVGVLGLLVALGVWLTRPRGRTVPVSTRRAAGERLS